MSKSFGLEILHVDKKTGARYGILHTPHGDVETPMFMPVGTNATLKMLSPEQVAACGSGVVLANTYHLHIRPGAEIVKKAGGLHKFMNLNKDEEPCCCGNVPKCRKTCRNVFIFKSTKLYRSIVLLIFLLSVFNIFINFCWFFISFSFIFN